MAWLGWPAPSLWVSGFGLLFFAVLLLLSPRGCRARRDFRGLLMTRSQRLLFRIGLVPQLLSVQAQEGGHVGRGDAKGTKRVLRTSWTSRGVLNHQSRRMEKQAGEAPEFLLREERKELKDRRIGMGRVGKED